MSANNTLNAKAILNKTFEKDVKGYDALEVDQFLDVIIKDYISFEKYILELESQLSNIQKENSDLRVTNGSLQVDNAKMRNRLTNIKEGDLASPENIDYLHRINALEKALYRAGIDPSKIK